MEVVTKEVANGKAQTQKGRKKALTRPSPEERKLARQEEYWDDAGEEWSRDRCRKELERLRRIRGEKRGAFALEQIGKQNPPPKYSMPLIIGGEEVWDPRLQVDETARHLWEKFARDSALDETMLRAAISFLEQEQEREGGREGGT